MSVLRLFHTSHQVIEKPDVKYGRRNADLGPGFYLSDNEEFSKRWARKQKGLSTWLNAYELDLTGLSVKRFSRDEEWFDHIYSNRSNRPDHLSGYDVVIGPIANDTIYETWGIITSGFLNKEQALRLLMIGGEYKQIVVKTQKAADGLQFKEAVEIQDDEIDAYRSIVREEEMQFQKEFAELVEKMAI